MRKLLIAVFLFCITISYAQSDLTGIVRHGIYNTESPFITIILTQKNKKIATTTSDTTGYFEIKELKPGLYDLTLAFVGYQKYEYSNININSDSSTFIELKYPCPFGNEKKKKVCPKGHTDNIIPIVYGLPTEKTWKKAEKGKLMIGGCIITECSPKWHCKTHNIDF